MLLSAALAAEAECAACCRAAGIDECEQTLRVFGEESDAARERGGWRADGLYVVGCDGRAHFDEDRVAYFQGVPADGELAMPESDPRAIACFMSSCRLPRDGCISPPDTQGRQRLVDCATGTPLDAYAIRRGPGETPSSSPAPLVVSIPPAPLVVSIPPAPRPSAVLVEGAILTSTPPAASRADPFTGSLPGDPPTPCRPPGESLYQAARAQVLLADDKRIVDDHPGAVAGYRAALTMDACSAYGWLGLGQSALELGRPDIAVRALKNATRLLPTHYGAWVDLGRAFEAIQQPTSAHRAYEAALALKADLPDANAGWRRTSSD